jgi:hypothetical protein
MPWAAASTVPTVGLRKRERVHGGWLGAFRATKDVVPSFLPYSLPCTGSRPQRGHGGAATLDAAV